MKPILIREKKTFNASIDFDCKEYKYFYHPLHYHPEIELTLILKSYGQRQIGDSIENFDAGDLVLVGENLPHVWRNDEVFSQLDSELKVQAIGMKFLPDFAGVDFFNRPEMTAIKTLLFEHAPHGVKLKGRLRTKVHKMMLKLPHLSDVEKFIALLSILNVIAISSEKELLASITYRNIKKENTDRINKVLDFLMLNYQKEITLDDVAEKINMNKNAFCRFFKQGMKKSLFTVLNEIRIAKSCQHLIQTDMDVAQICYSNGFNNISNFSKAFKKITGISPLNYRKAMKYKSR